MPKLRVYNFAISLDGYPTDPNQSHEHLLGVGGERLHEWRVAPVRRRSGPPRRRVEQIAIARSPERNPPVTEGATGA